MTIFNVCTRLNYQKDGKLKTQWFRVGTLKISGSGRMYLHLYQQPETHFYVFDSEEKNPAVDPLDTQVTANELLQ